MQYEKLVRDKIPEILKQKGVPFQSRIADDQEFQVELIKKFEEETGEFKEDPSPEELADVLEVIYALLKLPKYLEVEKIRTRKAEERGVFEKRLIVKEEK